MKTYLEGEKLLLEISNTLLNQQMLFVRHNDGQRVSYKHVVWSKFKDRIFLEAVRVESLTGIKIPIPNNSENNRSILAAFSIIKEKSTSKTFFIEISDFLLSDYVEWERTSHQSIVKDLSFIKKVKNISNEVLIQTIWGVFKDQARITIPVDFSFYQLPEPMSPRLFDFRMGFRTENREGFLSNQTKNSIASIARWRLEKKYPNKTLSEPIKPIVFILSPEIPQKWWPYLRKGILDWLPPFEAAGFKNAIVVEDPSADNIKNTEFNSVTHSIVRWGNFRNVRGYEDGGGATINQVVDERSGEILKSDILMNSTLQFLMDAYFIRCAASDNRAQQYPFPDDLVGELLRSLIAHEAGHSFGLVDGHYGEYAYPFDKMRDQNWLHKMGHTPSIMTYARHNNLVQPEDGISPSLLIQKVGPTDTYSIRWGYTPFVKTDAIKNEEAFLETIIREQDTIPWYRRSIGIGEIIGPGATNEVVENDDPIKSAELALINLKKVMALIPEVNQDKKDYQVAERLYNKALDFWNSQMRQVLSLIGGFDIRYKIPAQKGRMYTSIPLDKQYKALDFFLLHAFNPPNWLANPEWRQDIKYSTYPDKLNDLQLHLLSDLVSPLRLKRLEHIEDNIDNLKICRKVMAQIRYSLFKELKEKQCMVDSSRKEIQQFYIDRLVFGIEYKGELSLGDVKRFLYSQNAKGIFKNELMLLKKEISNKFRKDKNDSCQGHLGLLLQGLKRLE
ncbi:MAG: zinc-dependent metalloprotease [Cellulophaga sp.]|nr:zinc-dependent metalloprotease [Cellulophaga sp.]